MESYYSVDDDEIQLTITAIIYNFLSDIHLHYTSTKPYYLSLDELRAHECDIDVFANGYRKENKGYISLCFYNFLGNCIVSLIDSSGTQKFSQSFTISCPNNMFSVGKYISHKRLILDPDNLFPNDTLTLKIYASITTRRPIYRKIPSVDPDVFLNFKRNSGDLELLLDSPLAKRLFEESSFFHAMLDSPMIESKTKIMPVPEEEFWPFRDIARLLLGGNYFSFKSIKDIFNMYILADKYDISFVYETCTCFLKLYASVYSTNELFKIVDEYVKIDCFSELLANKICQIWEQNYDEEIDKTNADRFFFKQPVHGCLWVYYPWYSSKPLFANQSQVARIHVFINDENKMYAK